MLGSLWTASSPQPGGSCTIICGRDGAVIFNWSDTDSPTSPDTPDSGNISDSAQDLPSKLDGDKTFQITKGNIYKFNGKYYVAGATPNEFNQYYIALPDNNDNGWLYIEVDPKHLQSPKTSKDLTDGKANFNIGDVYRTDDGNYYIRHYDNGNRPVDDLDTSANWVKINYTK